MSAMGSGGPLAAIDVCHVEAPAIAAGLSAATAARVGRTSLKTRNPANAPDRAASAVLERFERDWAATDAATRTAPAEAQAAAPEHFAVAPDGSARYMKGIVTQGMCLVCHGTSLAPDVAAALRARYPEDRATGYSPGDLRGAFIIEWPATPAADRASP